MEIDVLISSRYSSRSNYQRTCGFQTFTESRFYHVEVHLLCTVVNFVVGWRTYCSIISQVVPTYIFLSLSIEVLFTSLQPNISEALNGSSCWLSFRDRHTKSSLKVLLIGYKISSHPFFEAQGSTMACQMAKSKGSLSLRLFSIGAKIPNIKVLPQGTAWMWNALVRSNSRKPHKSNTCSTHSLLVLRPLERFCNITFRGTNSVQSSKLRHRSLELSWWIHDSLKNVTIQTVTCQKSGCFHYYSYSR